MNQKEYELIAGAIYRTRIINDLDKNQVRRNAKEAAICLLINDLIGTLKHTYPKTFNEEKFLRSVGG